MNPGASWPTKTHQSNTLLHVNLKAKGMKNILGILKFIWKGTNFPSKMHVVNINNNIITKSFERKPALDVQQNEFHHQNPKKRGILRALFDVPAGCHMSN